MSSRNSDMSAGAAQSSARVVTVSSKNRARMDISGTALAEGKRKSSKATVSNCVLFVGLLDLSLMCVCSEIMPRVTQAYVIPKVIDMPWLFETQRVLTMHTMMRRDLWLHV